MSKKKSTKKETEVPNIIERDDNMVERREIIISDERILRFYEKNKNIDIVKINLLYIELFENILNASFDNSAVVNNILSTLHNQTHELSSIKYSTEAYRSDMRDMYTLSINNIKSEIENIKSVFSNISGTLITKLYESKDSYVSELRELLKMMDIDTRQNMSVILEKQNNILQEKLIYLINETLPKTQSNQYNEIINNFKREMDISFNEIKSKDPHIIIEKIGSIVEQKYNNLLLNINENIGQSENRLNMNINNMRDISSKSGHTQESINEEIIKYINKHNNSCSKGTLGENLLYNILIEELPVADIINTSNQTGKGDFIIKRKDKIDVLIETKEYTSNVKREEVEKFIRDVNKNDCHGVFISQKSGIVNKENYQIEVNDNKILVYIHKMNYEGYKIGLGLRLIDMLSEKLKDTGSENIVIPVDILKEINEEYINLSNTKSKLIMELKEYSKKTLERYESINLNTLEKYLSKHYANIKKNLYICEYCKEYKCEKLLSLARHKRACKKKCEKVLEEESTE